MVQPRVYVFRGNASGVAAHIRRPVDLLVPVQAASSLPVTGGLSESRVVGPISFGRRTPPTSPATHGMTSAATEYISFDSASTSARGDFVDRELAIAMTFGKVPFDEVPTETTVTAEVTNLTVIGRVKVGLAAMGLQAQSTDEDEPPIRCDGSRLEGVSVDGYPVDITLDCNFFCECDTLAKLRAAAVAGINKQCFFDAGTAARYGFRNPTGIIKCTLVTKMQWAAQPHPDAVIDGNAIIIPNFGKVYFAELFVTAASRRLTMARFQLGSDDGGDASAAEGDTNGAKWPPDGP